MLDLFLALASILLLLIIFIVAYWFAGQLLGAKEYERRRAEYEHRVARVRKKIDG